MRNLLALALIGLAAAFVLMACGSDVTVEEDDVSQEEVDPLAGQLVWLGVSGELNGMNGAWLGICENNAPNSERETVIFSGNIVVSAYQQYTGNTVCSGAGTAGATNSFVITNIGTKTATWGTAPPAGLASTYPVSDWEFYISGSPQQRIALVDDRSTPRVLYTGNSTTVILDENRPYVEQ